MEELHNIIFSACVLFISICAFLMNLFALCVYHVYRDIRIHSYLNALTIQFTFAGFLKSILYFVFSFSSVFYDTWKFGNTGCQCYIFLSTWFDVVEVYTATLYGWMSMMSMKHEESFRKFTRRRVSSIFHLIWIVAAIYAALPILSSVRYKVNMAYYSCSIDIGGENSTKEIIFYSISCLIILVLPSIAWLYFMHIIFWQKWTVEYNVRIGNIDKFLWEFQCLVSLNMILRFLYTTFYTLAVFNIFYEPYVIQALSVAQSLILLVHPLCTWYTCSKVRIRVMELLGGCIQPVQSVQHYEIIREKTLSHKLLKSLKILVTNIQMEPADTDRGLWYRRMYRVAYSVEGYPCLFQILHNVNGPCNTFIDPHPYQIQCQVTEKNVPSVSTNNVNEIFLRFYAELDPSPRAESPPSTTTNTLQEHEYQESPDAPLSSGFVSASTGFRQTASSEAAGPSRSYYNPNIRTEESSSRPGTSRQFSNIPTRTEESTSGNIAGTSQPFTYKSTSTESTPGRIYGAPHGSHTGSTMTEQPSTSSGEDDEPEVQEKCKLKRQNSLYVSQRQKGYLNLSKRLRKVNKKAVYDTLEESTAFLRSEQKTMIPKKPPSPVYGSVLADFELEYSDITEENSEQMTSSSSARSTGIAGPQNTIPETDIQDGEEREFSSIVPSSRPADTIPETDIHDGGGRESPSVTPSSTPADAILGTESEDVEERVPLSVASSSSPVDTIPDICLQHSEDGESTIIAPSSRPAESIPETDIQDGEGRESPSVAPSSTPADAILGVDSEDVEERESPSAASSSSPADTTIPDIRIQHAEERESTLVIASSSTPADSIPVVQLQVPREERSSSSSPILARDIGTLEEEFKSCCSSSTDTAPDEDIQEVEDGESTIIAPSSRPAESIPETDIQDGEGRESPSVAPSSTPADTTIPDIRIQHAEERESTLIIASSSTPADSIPVVRLQVPREERSSSSSPILARDSGTSEEEFISCCSSSTGTAPDEDIQEVEDGESTLVIASTSTPAPDQVLNSEDESSSADETLV